MCRPLWKLMKIYLLYIFIFLAIFKVLNIAIKSLSSLLYHGKCFASLTGTTIDPLL